MDKLTSVVLWHAKYYPSAYTDQCGVPREGFVVLDEVEAEIVDSRPVPGDYSDTIHDHQIGYRAICTKTGRHFHNNWTRWPDTSTTPDYSWYEVEVDEHGEATKIIELWANAYACAGKRYMPYVRDNQLAIPPLPFCEEHKVYSNKGSECYLCWYFREKSKQEKKNG